MDLYQEAYDQDQDFGGITESTITNYEEFNAYREGVLDVIAQSDAAVRLSENPDFKAIIMDAYLVDEPKRLGLLMGSGKVTERIFDQCSEDLRGIGNLRQFLSQYVAKGNLAREELEALDMARKAAIEDGSAT